MGVASGQNFSGAFTQLSLLPLSINPAYAPANPMNLLWIRHWLAAEERATFLGDPCSKHQMSKSVFWRNCIAGKSTNNQFIESHLADYFYWSTS